jgi:hypothetical protein
LHTATTGPGIGETNDLTSKIPGKLNELIGP